MGTMERWRRRRFASCFVGPNLNNVSTGEANRCAAFVGPNLNNVSTGEAVGREKREFGKGPHKFQQLVPLIQEASMCDGKESMWSMLNKEVKSGKLAVNILEMKRQRKKLVFLAYVWDERLLHIPRSTVANKISFQEKHAEINVVTAIPSLFIAVWMVFI